MAERPSTRKCRVLLIYREMIPSIRLCGHSQMEAMARLGMVEYRAVQEMRLKGSDLSWADTVMLGRLDSWYEHQLAQRLREAGRRLVYIIDDDLLDIPPTASSAPHYGDAEVRHFVQRLIDISDAILSPSKLLLEKYARNGRQAVWVEEPALDPVPYAPHDPDAPVRIGFAGSIDRTADLEALLRDALLRVKAKYGEKVRFEFFGAEPDFARQLGARTLPYYDSYEKYRAALNDLAWDIGLAPMPDTPFHACKHYNKFTEYAAAGVAGIYSDCAPYTFIPDRERYGRFCRNTPEAWYEQLCREIEDAPGREERRRQCSLAAQSWLSAEHIGRELLEHYAPLFEPIEAGEIEAPGIALLKVRSFFHEKIRRVRRYGLKTPVVVARKLLGRSRVFKR